MNWIRFKSILRKNARQTKQDDKILIGQTEIECEMISFDGMNEVDYFDTIKVMKNGCNEMESREGEKNELEINEAVS